MLLAVAGLLSFVGGLILFLSRLQRRRPRGGARVRRSQRTVRRRIQLSRRGAWRWINVRLLGERPDGGRAAWVPTRGRIVMIGIAAGITWTGLYVLPAFIKEIGTDLGISKDAVQRLQWMALAGFLVAVLVSQRTRVPRRSLAVLFTLAGVPALALLAATSSLALMFVAAAGVGIASASQIAALSAVSAAAERVGRTTGVLVAVVLVSLVATRTVVIQAGERIAWSHGVMTVALGLNPLQAGISWRWGMAALAGLWVAGAIIYRFSLGAGPPPAPPRGAGRSSSRITYRALWADGFVRRAVLAAGLSGAALQAHDSFQPAALLDLGFGSGWITLTGFVFLVGIPGSWIAGELADHDPEFAWFWSAVVTLAAWTIIVAGGLVFQNDPEPRLAWMLVGQCLLELGTTATTVLMPAVTRHKALRDGQPHTADPILGLVVLGKYGGAQLGAMLANPAYVLRGWDGVGELGTFLATLAVPTAFLIAEIRPRYRRPTKVEQLHGWATTRRRLRARRRRARENRDE